MQRPQFVFGTEEEAQRACDAINASLTGNHPRLVYRAASRGEVVFVVAMNAGKARSFAAEHFEIAVEPARKGGPRVPLKDQVTNMSAQEIEELRGILARFGQPDKLVVGADGAREISPNTPVPGERTGPTADQMADVVREAIDEPQKTGDTPTGEPLPHTDGGRKRQRR